LDWLDGTIHPSCGPARAPASPSPLPVSKRAKRTEGTSGQPLQHSSVPDGPMSSWENRLRQRLESIGSTECILTWKASATASGLSLSRLVPSMPPTDGTAFGLWPTPVANDDNKSPAAHMAMKRRMKGGPRNCITSLQVMAKAQPLGMEPNCSL